MAKKKKSVGQRKVVKRSGQGRVSPRRSPAKRGPWIEGPLTAPVFVDGERFVITLEGTDLGAVDLDSLRLESTAGTFSIDPVLRPLVHAGGTRLTLWGGFRWGRPVGRPIDPGDPIDEAPLTVVYKPPPKKPPIGPPPRGCEFIALFLAGASTGREPAQAPLLDTYQPPRQRGRPPSGPPTRPPTRPS